MRDIVVLVLFVGLIYFGVRQFGCSSAGEANPTQAATAKADKGESGMKPDEPAAPSRRETLERATKELVAGRELPNAEQLQPIATGSEPGAEGEWARALLLASTDPSPASRWTALSRLVAVVPVDHESRHKLVRLAADAAPQALRLPEASVSYRVVRGDALAKICGKLKKEHGVETTPGLLRWLNGLQNDTIYPDQELKAPKSPVRIWVSKSGFLLRAYVGDGLIAEFPVGIGREGRTPAGTFTIRAPMKKAPWRNPETGQILHFGDEGYAIGTRWLGFEPNGPHVGLGIHGTNEPDSVGTAASLGCVRMRNPDVEQLFEWVPEGTQVQIVD